MITLVYFIYIKVKIIFKAWFFLMDNVASGNFLLNSGDINEKYFWLVKEIEKDI